MSELLAMIHDNASDLYEAGLINKTTMQDFDKLCLTPVQNFSSEEIRAIREKERVSQSVFAHYLNVNKNMVSEWERGGKTPGRTALKGLSRVQHKGIEAII